MLELIGYGLAVVMGVTLGLIGAGGSILTVPILVYFLGVTPVIATGYSLLIVGITAAIGSVRYYHKQLIDFHTVIVFALPSLLAVYAARAWLLPAIPDVLLAINGWQLSKDMFIMLLFAILMWIAAVLMIKNGSALKAHHDYSLTTLPTSWPAGAMPNHSWTTKNGQ